MSPRFVIFVVVSLLTHLMDVAASGLFCHMLVRNDGLKTPWFSISAGLLIIPIVGLQLISAIYLLRRKGENSTTLDVTLTAILHVLQLGFVSRHFAILQESSIPSKKYEIAEMLILRMVFSLTSGFPLLLIKMHVLFLDNHESSWDWTLYLTSATAVVSITWALATFRRCLSGIAIDVLLVTCPGTILKFFWRAGEIIARIIAISLFASIYNLWIFLVIGLHWLAMLICVCVPAITPLELSSNNVIYRSFCSFVASFTYIFVFINTTSENTVFRYTFYYIIFFLENTILVTVWSVQASQDELDKNELFVYVAAVAFILGIVSMIVYYKFFHILSPKDSPTVVCDSPACVSCKSDVSASHPPIPPRPGNNGHWLSQYHTAIYCGQHCKNTGQDSLLDSTSERNSVLTVSSSHARLQQKLATIADDNSNKSNEQSCKKMTDDKGSGVVHLESSVTNEHSDISPRSRSRKKSKSKKRNESGSRREKDKKKSTREKSATHCGNTSEDSGSQKQPVWLPNGDSNFANQLLTYSLETFETNDTADDERSSVATNAKEGRNHFRREISSREISSVHRHIENTGAWSMLKRGDDRHWYSDGYSTDRTLDWPNYPGASITSNTYNPSLETDEAHRFHCHECSHGDSEVSSIMRSIDDVPEHYPTEGRRSREISPRSPREHTTAGDYKKNHHHQHHHQSQSHSHYRRHHHHHHHHHPYHDNDDYNKHSHKGHRQSRINDPNPKSLNVTNATSKKEREVNQGITKSSHKIQVSATNRAHMLSSPASDPSHGPKPKRKGSAKRRVHGSNHPDKSKSRGLTMKQSVAPNSPEDLIRQSEQIATDLLAKSKSSAFTDKNKKHELTSTKVVAADPRFNVRVMISNGNESPRDKSFKGVDNHELPSSTSHSSPAVKVTSLQSTCDDSRANKDNKKIVHGVTNNETDVDSYNPAIGNSDFSEGKNVSSHSHRSKSSTGDRDGSRSGFAPPDQLSSDSRTTSSENSTKSKIVDSAKDDVIYENIWQVKKDNNNISNKRQTGIKNLAFVGDEPSKVLSSSGVVRDAWYLCSESEDSALPQEILSSSVDGFTASENGSDLSAEIVI